jgi:hypothetical protein
MYFNFQYPRLNLPPQKIEPFDFFNENYWCYCEVSSLVIIQIKLEIELAAMKV